MPHFHSCNVTIQALLFILGCVFWQKIMKKKTLHVGERFMITKEPGMWVHQYNTKSVHSENTLTREYLLTLARATQSKLEIKKNTKTLLLCNKEPEQ